MSAIQVILNVCLILASLVMIVTVLLQSSEDDGMGALTGGKNDSFFGKAKNAAFEAKMALGTKISAAVFVVLALIMVLVG